MGHKDRIVGKWALVTGASSGLGLDFAEDLARRKVNLVLVARREDRLQQLGQRLEQDYGIETQVIAQDLARPEAAEELHQEVIRRGLKVTILVNNAGLGIYGQDLHLPLEKVQAMLNVDIYSLVGLTKLFAQDMVEAGEGYILQVASIGAYQATPTYAAYAAAKSFVLHYSEALDYELAGTGVSCTTLSPGVTKTEFLEVSGQETTLYQRLMMMSSPQVAKLGIKAMLNRRRSIIPGRLNTLLAWSIRLMPRSLTHWVAELTMRNPETSAPAKRLSA